MNDKHHRASVTLASAGTAIGLGGNAILVHAVCEIEAIMVGGWLTGIGVFLVALAKALRS